MAAGGLPAVAVLGIGGVGGVLAASLATAGRCRLTLVARGAAHRRLCRDGLTVQLHEGHTVHCRPDAVLDAEGLAQPPPQDIVLVATKSHQLTAAIPALLPLLGPETVVVPCVNGLPWWYFHGTGGREEGLQLQSVDPGGALHTAVSPERVLGTVGMTSGDLDRSEGGIWRSKWPTERNHITVGDPVAGGGRSARTDAVAALFCSEQVPVRIEVCDDIRSAVFDKLLINASLNTISSLTHTDCGQVVGDPQLRALLTAMVAEVEQVAAALDPPPSLQWSAAKIVEIYTGQFGLRTSMMQDLQARRELERAGIVVGAPTLAADAWLTPRCPPRPWLSVPHGRHAQRCSLRRMHLWSWVRRSVSRRRCCRQAPPCSRRWTPPPEGCRDLAARRWGDDTGSSAAGRRDPPRGRLVAVAARDR